MSIAKKRKKALIWVTASILILTTGCFSKQEGESNVPSPSPSANANVTITRIPSSTVTPSVEGKYLTEKKAVKRFIEALSNDDAETFKSIISPSGLTLIRNFISGNGTRGKDIRSTFNRDNIPNGIRFPVKGEDDIVIKDFFRYSINNKKGVDIPCVEAKNINFNFFNNVISKEYGPSTSKVWDLCGEIQAAASHDDSSAVIYILGDKEFALSEATQSFNIGDWAVFEKTYDNWNLRAVMDFR